MGQSSGDKDLAGVIAPPPVIFLGFLLLGLVINHFWPLAIAGGIPTVVRLCVGAAVAVTGVVIGVAGFRQFRKAGTNMSGSSERTIAVSRRPCGAGCRAQGAPTFR